MNDELRYVKIDKDFGDLRRVEEIYNTAFPPEERFFSVKTVLQNIDEIGETELYAAYDGDMLIGFSAVSVNKEPDYKYLQFIAVDPTIRSKGYGGRILKKLLKENEDLIVFASIEKPVPDGDNYDIKSRRQQFYERNGMITVNRERTVNGVTFIIVTNKTGDEFDRCYENEIRNETRQIEESRKMNGNE